MIRAGRKPYVVGRGGSSPVGCLGYAACAREIAAQEAALGERFARIVVPNGSFRHARRLAAGFAAVGDDPLRVKSFTVLAPLEEARAATLEKARATLELLEPEAELSADAIDVAGDQLGAGYGIPTEALRGVDSRDGVAGRSLDRSRIWCEGVRGLAGRCAGGPLPRG